MAQTSMTSPPLPSTVRTSIAPLAGAEGSSTSFQEDTDNEILRRILDPERTADDGTDDGQLLEPQDDDGDGSEAAFGSGEDLLGSATLLADLDLDALASGLSLEECRRVVEQAKALLESFYVHLPFKRALHGVDPIRKLDLLLYRLADETSAELPTPLELHREILRILSLVCDRHTAYLIPSPLGDKVAFLGIKVEDCVDEAGRRRYLVAHVDRALTRGAQGDPKSFLAPDKERGKNLVEVVSWNGVPIERAVELNSELHAGSNSAARRARGLQRLTLRPLRTSLPPDERTVRIGYRLLKGRDERAPAEVREVELPWKVLDRKSFREVEESSCSEAWGLDVEGDTFHQMGWFLFASGAEEPGAERCPPICRSFLSKRVLDGRLGYLRIFSFNADPRDLVEEFLRHIRGLPQEGLILDVRGNSGGSIRAAECMLQLLTPRPIEPARFQVRNTAAIRELCRQHSPSVRYPGLDLEPWRRSLEQAERTGAEHSRAFPITSVKACNVIGQRYYGPVVLITDALSYSATDVFAAGFQDHSIGPIVGVGGRTGGGGANVFTHELLCALTPRLRALPPDLSMKVAFRRALRVGERAGMPLESFGVEPDDFYQMTSDDLLQDNAGLIAFAAEKLAGQPVYRLRADVRWSDGSLRLTDLKTRGIERLDVYVDDRPLGSIDPERTTTVLGDVSDEASVLELRGYELDRSPAEPSEGVERFLPGARADRLVARRKLWIPRPPVH